MVNLKAEDKASYPKQDSLLLDQILYKFGHQISIGSTCKIYKAYDSFKTRLVLKEYVYPKHQALWLNEIRRYQTLNHRNMVRMIACQSDASSAQLILERYPYTLGMINLPTDSEKRERMAYAVARGLLDFLHYLHGNGLIHSDINPNNILVVANSLNQAFEDIKICDFALVKEPQGSQFGEIARWILPPEFITRTHGPTYGMDVYHAALIIYQVLSGQTIEYSDEEILAHKPFKDISKYASSLAAPLAAAVLNNPDDRPSAIELWGQIVKAYAGRGKVIYH